jgi:hypothetical protein
MKLAFNMMECGLGNNGGTRTILLCQKTLEELGHVCDVIARNDSFTWFKHKPAVSYVPSYMDAIIATACTTVDSTYRSNARVKAWYIRAHEDWTYSNRQLQACYNKGLMNIVNSNGLKQVLAAWGADSHVIYQGIDFDWWEDRKLRKENVIRIGCLCTKQSRKRWKDFVKLYEILGDKGYEYVSVGNAKPAENFLARSWVNVDHDELCDAYSSCHIWFAPTESEGLHNVPMEANLCGCLVVCGDEPLNGMIYDYAFPGNTAMVYNRKDIDHAAELIRNPNWELVDKMQKCIRERIGTRQTNMKKLIKFLGDKL